MCSIVFTYFGKLCQWFGPVKLKTVVHECLKTELLKQDAR